MGSVRLNDFNRGLLRDLVKSKVVFEAETKALSRRKNSLDERVLGVIKKEFPEYEMEILKKYNVTEMCTSFSLIKKNTSVLTRYELDEPIIVADGGFMNKRISVSEKLYGDVEKFLKSQNQLNEDTRKARSPYFELIKNSKTFNEVLEVWPEAAELKKTLGNNSLMLLPKKVKEGIRNDMQRRGVA